ncbi:MAG: sugar phosphate isomerase/epimerase family protein [Anaerolineae bacterium]
MWTLAIITDEVSHDFVRALDTIKSWDMKYVEIRTVDRVNAADLDEAGVARVKRLLDERGLKVAALASPFLKCYLHEPKAGPAGDAFFSSANTYEEHLKILQRCGNLAKVLGANMTRCFSFWREPDPAAVFAEVAERLKDSVQLAEQYGLVLAMENETSCNGGVPVEVRDLVAAVDSKALGVMWDAGNAQWADVEAFPDGYDAIKDRIFHVHVKDIVHDNGTVHGTVFGEGEVNFRGMFMALLADGYDGALSLEPHFKPGEPGPTEKVQACVDNLRAMLRDLGIRYE